MKEAELNVEELMKELKEKAKARKAKEEIPNFNEMTAELDSESLQFVERYDREEFIRELTEVNHHYWINPDVDISKESFLKRKVKGLIKKLTQFLTRPLIDQQNEFNIVVVRAMNQIRNYLLTHDNVDCRIEELQLMLEKEVLKPMELYSLRYQTMEKTYQELFSTIEKLMRTQKEQELKLRLLEAELQIEEQKNGGQ